MEDHCLPKIVLYAALTTSCHKRSPKKEKKRYKDSLKQYLSFGHIEYYQWSALASNQETWRHTIHNAAASFENHLQTQSRGEKTTQKEPFLASIA
ncbi:hypothetical protein WISP_57365 [Willisornis vidua]|uniref:Uncharacterized protein n=1 Tax=Willisornis vidua TaxID=1566151 RepID=A0ABQ9DCX7_9PASS|nr:hypothetical protein WISP_57365 [Willisornis vidua]